MVVGAYIAFGAWWTFTVTYMLALMFPTALGVDRRRQMSWQKPRAVARGDSD